MTYRALPTLDELNRLFEYKAGNLYWKITLNSRAVMGSVAGSVDKRGYCYVKLNKQSFLVHRIIWKLLTKEEPIGVVDHIDRNRSNNNITNLRVVNTSVNILNQDALGYSKCKDKYQARIKIKGKTKHLGYFKTKEEATSCYREARDAYINKTMEQLKAGEL